MAQRGIVWEVDDDGFRSVVDILEWPEDRLDLNKRRLRRHIERRFSGVLSVMIEQIDGPRRGDKIYTRDLTV